LGLHCYALSTHPDELVLEPPLNNPGFAYERVTDRAYMAFGLQSSVLPVLCIPSNCAKRKVQTEKQLSYILTMRWTTRQKK